MIDQELAAQIKQAAMSMLTDMEICSAVGITADELDPYRTVIEQARTTLKQQLNAKRIKDAATGRGDMATQLVQTIPKPKISSRGGARPNAGRPRGTTNKISGQQILASIEELTGTNFSDLLAQGYVESIETNDRPTRLQYEKLFLSKVVADKVEIDLNENQEILAFKQQAFAEAVKTLAQKDAQGSKD